MTNKDLFKQAIAEAKTIREAAITNAKEALEESLTPHLKEMLAQKLQEMEEEEDKVDETVNNAEAEGFAENPNTHGNLEEAEEEEEETEEEAPEGEEETGEEEEEELEIEDMSVEDLKNLIRDIVAQETGHDESEEELPGEEAPEGEDMIGTDDSEEIDINELLAELEGIDEEEVKEKELNENVDIIYELINMFPFLTNSTAQMLVGAFGAAGLTGLSVIIAKVQEMALKGSFGDKAKAFAENLQQSGKDAANITQQREGAEEEEMEEGFGDAIKGAAQRVGRGLEKAYDAVANAPELGIAKSFEKNVIDKGAAGLKKAGFLGTGMTKGHRAFEGQDEELNEALKAVKILRNQLQEVNLLNAKLLYVNKVFKSTNLSEGQKVNVIAAFDKAETVREVKLVFETVSKNVVAKKPTSIKEHTSFASKPTGTTAAPQKEVINEVSEQVLRMQKLAGIIK
jgi:hypothetical protein